MRTIALLFALAITGRSAVSDEPAQALTAKPQWQRRLQEEDAVKSQELWIQIHAALDADRFEEAIALHEQLLELRTRVQGADHWETIKQRWALDAARRVSILPRPERTRWRDAAQVHNQAWQLAAAGHAAEALPLYRKVHQVNCELLGEKHTFAAVSGSAVAFSLHHAGDLHAAQPYFQRALDINLELLGPRHPDTARSYNDLAFNLQALGRNSEALPLFQLALDLRRELLGELHPDTSGTYGDVAFTLSALGRHAEAQPLYLRALELDRAHFGDHHPATSRSYNNLAGNLADQGRHAEALPFQQKALEALVANAGAKQTELPTCYNNLALKLAALGRHDEASPIFQKALDLRREMHGERHPATANSYFTLADQLAGQGLHAEAEPLYRTSLEIRRELLGERHSDTAQSYSGLALNLNAQRRFAEARPLFETTMSLFRDLFGEKHASTGMGFNNLGFNLAEQGFYQEARPLLVLAAEAYEAARLSATDSGLERAAYGARRSPYPMLAALQARLGEPIAAWESLEHDLARGLMDAAAIRSRTPVAAVEADRHAALNTRLSHLQSQILQLVARPTLSDPDRAELSRLQDERRMTEAALSELAVLVSQRELEPLAKIQAAIPQDAALVYWIDVTGHGGLEEHWGCVVRRFQGPAWERLSGSGPGGTWTAEDSDLPEKVNAAAAGSVWSAESVELAARLHAQRIAPLEPHLEGVRRLFVVPVNSMADVPVDVLTDRYCVSYVPSGTFIARLGEPPAPGNASLLALGDPAYPAIDADEEPPLPPGGLLITQVVPGGNAALAGLQPGDVLLSYAGAELTSADRLGELIQDRAQESSISIAVWRDGQTDERLMPAGKLGVALANETAPKAIAAGREADQMLALSTRGGHWGELPGTSVEVARLQSLIGDDHTTALTRSDASEQALEQLRAGGKLKDFRYLHFATHGEPNNAHAFESALILAQDQITGEIPKGGGKYYDGRLTANEVLENWELNADLVTLSACESALGRPGGGDGLLGFAQAFLLAGSRSVCLSLWKVDDTATALLMDRFYQNLLGKREGLEQPMPMPKAEALAEAKQWLRTLNRVEVKELWDGMASGVQRGTGEAAIPLVPAVEEHRYSHPRYWAAFVLIGSPE